MGLKGKYKPTQQCHLTTLSTISQQSYLPNLPSTSASVTLRGPMESVFYIFDVFERIRVCAFIEDVKLSIFCTT